MSIAARIKGFGSVVLGLAFLIGMMTIGVALLTGAAAFSVWILKWTFPAFTITLLLTLFVIVPLALIPPTRGFAAIGFLIASFAFGAILWLWGMGYTYTVWGMFGVIIGLVFLGIGVVPVAMLAALLHGDWGNLGLFVGTAILTYGLRGLANWLATKADERTVRLNQPMRAYGANERRPQNAIQAPLPDEF